MAHVLTLQVGSATPIALTLDDDYVPTARQQGEATVIERIPVVVDSTTQALMVAAKEAIEAALVAAHARQETGAGDRVYLNFTPDGYASAYRSEIVSGLLLPKYARFSYEWAEHRVHFMLQIERVNFWEGALVELALLNGSIGAKATGGVTITNHDDAGAGHDDYVEIAAADVVGSLPAPIKLTLTSAAGGVEEVYISHNARGSPADFPHIIEGETSSVGSPITSSACSGGYGQDCVSYGGSTASWSFTLAAATLVKAGGRWHRLMARMNIDALVSSAEVRVRAGLLVSGVIVWLGSWQGPYGRTGDVLVDFGVAALPPKLDGVTLAGSLTLAVYLKLTNYNGQDAPVFLLDFVQLSPLDGWRALSPVGAATVPAAGALVDDGIAGELYVLSAGATLITYVGGGAPILLLPATLQRLYILHEPAVISRTLVVRAYYRPRRLTI